LSRQAKDGGKDEQAEGASIHSLNLAHVKPSGPSLSSRHAFDRSI
jgi:hypothetical protein